MIGRELAAWSLLVVLSVVGESGGVGALCTGESGLCVDAWCHLCLCFLEWSEYGVVRCWGGVRVRKHVRACNVCKNARIMLPLRYVVALTYTFLVILTGIRCELRLVVTGRRKIADFRSKRGSGGGFVSDHKCKDAQY